MNLQPWRPELLPALVRYWNRAFADRRNFFPVTESVLAGRILDRPEFNADDLVLSLDGEEVTGMIHVGMRADVTQGYVAFLHVEPDRRRGGIGTALWHAGLERLAKAKVVRVDGQGMNPFYGTGDPPVTPLWGTPRGVAVDWGDSATKKFLAQKGHVPRFKALHMAIDLAAAEIPGESEVEGYSLGEEEPGRLVATGKEGEAGSLAYYEMRDVRPGLYGIHEARVEERHRGRGLGRMLLVAALAGMKARGASACEGLTLPEASPDEERVYRDAGFERVAAWALY